MTPAPDSRAARRAFAVPPELAGLGLALRPQTEADQPFLTQLYISMRLDELAPLTDWSEERKRAFLTGQFQLQCQHYAVYYGGADFLIAELGGKAIGRLYLERGAPDELRIVDIGFLPAWRGQGYGTALLGATLDEAAAESKFASIHVEQQNPARRLYERLGFRGAGSHGPYLLMEWRPVS